MWKDQMVEWRDVNENPLIKYLLSPNCILATGGRAPTFLPCPFLLSSDISSPIPPPPTRSLPQSMLRERKGERQSFKIRGEGDATGDGGEARP